MLIYILKDRPSNRNLPQKVNEFAYNRMLPDKKSKYRLYDELDAEIETLELKRYIRHNKDKIDEHNPEGGIS